VRETFEDEIATIEGRTLIPLSELTSRLDEVPRDGEIIIHCHSGVRSAHAAQLLQKAGFDRVYNLAGGIDAWSREIDPDVPRY
jgi:adenylyltransferase/sulfurtransferase